MGESYDLLPCPFCGGLPQGEDGPPSPHIRCSTPGCAAKQYGIPISLAVEKWNSRSALAGEAATAAKTPKSGLVHEHATAQPERPNPTPVLPKKERTK